VKPPFLPSVMQARLDVHLQLKHTSDRLAELVRIDGLTKIYNRREFMRVYDAEWRRAIRSSAPLAMVLIDVDHFKLFNDKYGHGLGDECLIKVAQTLKASVRRSSDLVARYGGEEFVAILPETDIQGAISFAESARQRIIDLNVPHGISPTADYVTASCGVASLVPSQQNEPRMLMEAADQALYQAKNLGRDRVCSLAA